MIKQIKTESNPLRFSYSNEAGYTVITGSRKSFDALKTALCSNDEQTRVAFGEGKETEYILISIKDS